jgi:DNA-binding NarL/FixJ family response regulator
MTTETREEILALLADGESLNAICKRKGMPSARSVYNWINDDPEFASQVTRARECGYLLRAERAVEAAQIAEDAAKGRLAFDAERWMLGKLSVALSDKQKLEHSGPNGAPIATTQRIERVIIDPANPDG